MGDRGRRPAAVGEAQPRERGLAGGGRGQGGRRFGDVALHEGEHGLRHRGIGHRVEVVEAGVQRLAQPRARGGREIGVGEQRRELTAGGGLVCAVAIAFVGGRLLVGATAGDEQSVDDRRRCSVAAGGAQRRLAHLLDLPREARVVQAALEPRAQQRAQVLAVADSVGEPACPADAVGREVDREPGALGVAAERRPAAAQDRGGDGVRRGGAEHVALGGSAPPRLDVLQPSVRADLDAVGLDLALALQARRGDRGVPGVEPVGVGRDRLAHQPLELGDRVGGGADQGGQRREAAPYALGVVAADRLLDAPRQQLAQQRMWGR